MSRRTAAAWCTCPCPTARASCWSCPPWWETRIRQSAWSAISAGTRKSCICVSCPCWRRADRRRKIFRPPADFALPFPPVCDIVCIFRICGYSSSVERNLPKVDRRVRLPLPAPAAKPPAVIQLPGAFLLMQEVSGGKILPETAVSPLAIDRIEFVIFLAKMECL